jgi:hypothetical protein
MLTRPGRVAVRAALAAAAVGAGAIHLAVAPEHLTEFPLLGVGFVLTAAAQFLWAGLVLRRDSARLLRIGALGSLLFVGVYAVSRTVGLPLGPEAFEAEPFGTADLVCCGLELAVAAGALGLATSTRTLYSPLRARAATVLAALLVTVGASTAVALAAPGEHGHAAETAPAACTAPCQPVHEHGHVG